jgi:hypothetical protein
MVALRNATSWSAQLSFFVAWLIWTGFVIIAVGARGKWQRFATGFSIAAASFALVAWGGYDDSSFPTDRLLDKIYEAVVVTEESDWQENASGYRWKDVTSTPDNDDFYMTGRSVIALLFGYLGGKFAAFSYRPRNAEDAA